MSVLYIKEEGRKRRHTEHTYTHLHTHLHSQGKSVLPEGTVPHKEVQLPLIVPGQVPQQIHPERPEKLDFLLHYSPFRLGHCITGIQDERSLHSF